MKQITNCKLCDISLRRKNIVNGSGDIESGIMFIGESPGYKEDKHGMPFIGKSSILFNTMLDLIGLYRSNVYVTNVLKCKVPNGRSPFAKEISNCKPNLQYEINVIKPKIIILLGSVALNTYFGTTTLKMNKFKGRIIKHRNRYIMAIYHPSYVLKNSHNKSLLLSYIHSFKVIGLMYKYLINALITTKI